MHRITPELMGKYLAGSPDTCPPFWDDYYREQLRSDPQPRRFQQTVVAVAALEAAMGSKPWLYKPDSISGGLRAHEIARAYNLTTIKDIDRTIGASRHKDDIISPNARLNFARARIVHDRFPNYAVVEPHGFEQATRSLANMRDFSGGARFEEEHFMAVWFPVVDRCRAMVLEGDRHFSRNGIWEVQRGILIQAGLSPLRPNADMDIMDIHGTHLTLADHAEKAAEYVSYALTYGFEPVEGATFLARLFQLDAWLRDPTSQDNPLDRMRLHPVLANRSDAECQRMDALKEIFVPILQKHCAAYLKQERLGDMYPVGEVPDHRPTFPLPWVPDPDALRGQYLSLHTAFDQPGVTRDINFADMSKPAVAAKTYEPDIIYFKPNTALFHDDWYNACSRKDRAGLPFIAGAMDTILAPATAAAQVIYVSRDVKAGQKARTLAQQFNLVGVAELRGALGDRFIPEIVEPARADMQQIVDRLRAKSPKAVIISDLDFDDVFTIVATQDQFAAFPGDPRLGPEARLAIRLNFMDRTITDHVVFPGWETSPSEVNKVLRTTLMQLDLIDRPFDGRIRGELYEVGRTTPLSLLDRMQRLESYVVDCITAGIDVPEQATVLARLIDLHDRLVDPAYNQHMLNVSRVAPSFLAYDAAQAREFRTRARTFLLDKAARTIREDGLHPDYQHAKRKQIEAERRAQQTSRKTELLGWDDAPLI